MPSPDGRSAGDAGPVSPILAAWDLGPDPTVIVDGTGTIVAANTAWRVACEVNEGDLTTCGVGVNYLAVCDKAAAAVEVAAALRSVLGGGRSNFVADYSARTPAGLRTSTIRINGFSVPSGRWAVVVHQDQTLTTAMQAAVADVAPGSPLIPIVPERVKRGATTPVRCAAGSAVGVIWIGLHEMRRVVALEGPAFFERLIRAIGHRIEQATGERGQLRRVLSDAFVIAAVDTDAAAIDALVDDLSCILRRPEREGATAVQPGAELGVRVWSGEGSPTWEQLVVEARAGSQVLTPASILSPGPNTTASGPTPRLGGVPVVEDGRSAAHVVLLVEDDPGDANLVVHALTRRTETPFEVVVTPSLAGARSVLSERDVDCVLLDLGLPDAEGSHSLHVLRSEYELLPIIVLTGRDDEELGRRLVRAGAQDYLRKGTLGADQLGRSIGFAIERIRAEALDRRMAALVAGTAEKVAIIGEDRVVTYASAGLSELGDWSGNVIGGDLLDLVMPVDRPRLAAEVDRLLARQAGRPVAAVSDVAITLVDGELHFASLEDMRCEPAVNGIMVRLRTDESRRAVERQVEVERALREAMTAGSLDLVLLLATDGTIEWASAASSRLLGVEPSELEGRRVFDLVDQRDQARVFADLAAMTELGDSVTVEFRVRLPSGEERWVEEIATNFLDDPSIGVVVGNVRDITERRAREEDSRLKSQLLAAVGQPVIALGPDHGITYWNDAATELFGWSREEVLGSDVRTLLPPREDPREAATAAAATDTIRMVKERWAGELTVRTKAGTEVVVAASATPIWQDSSYAGYIAVSSDVSDRVERERAIAHLAAIVDTSSDVIYSVDRQHRIMSWNSGAQSVYGYTSEEILGRHVTVLAAPSHRVEISDFVEAVLRGDTISAYQTQRQRRDGTIFDASISLSPIRDHTGEVTSAACISRDITQQIELLRRLEVSHRQLADAQRTANLGSFEIDLDTGEVDRSDELWRILGVTPGGLPAMHWDHVHPDDRATCERAFDRVLAGDLDVAAIYRVVRPDGEVRWVSARMTGLVPHSARKVSGTMLDITVSKQYEQELERLAFVDCLTDLPNREGLTRDLEHELRRVRSTGDDLTLAMIDLDQFKVINDTYDHLVGDEVLRSVGERLRAALDPLDRMARFGGDQFVVVSRGSDRLDELEEAIRTATREPVKASGHTFQISAGVGLVVVDQGSSIEAALRDADLALHAAKRGGRSRTKVFDDQLRLEILSAHLLEEDLREAVSSEAFHLVYQPVLDLQTGATVGFEALIRWNHPERGSVPPSEFIPLAERSGLVRDIGTWTLREGIEQLRRWVDLTGIEDAPWLAINLSPAQLTTDGLAAEVEELLETTRVPARCLHLELTETAMMSDVERSLRRLGDLVALGIEVDIDDFGTGYSSLNYLRRMPVATLKIDRSFVAGLGVDAQDTAIARMIVGLGRELGLHVQAEGVESERQLAVLHALGCERAQGFLWSPGIDAASATSWLLGSAVARTPGKTRSSNGGGAEPATN